MEEPAAATERSRPSIGAVTYFVRMVAKERRAEEVQQLLLENPRRIEQGEPGNLAFRVHCSIDNPNEFWLYEPRAAQEAVEAHESGATFCGTRRRCARWSNPTAGCSATVSR